MQLHDVFDPHVRGAVEKDEFEFVPWPRFHSVFQFNYFSNSRTCQSFLELLKYKEFFLNRSEILAFSGSLSRLVIIRDQKTAAGEEKQTICGPWINYITVR